MARPRLLDGVASRIGGVVDEALLYAARARFGRATPRSTGPAGSDRSAMLDEASAFYRQPRFLDGDGFYEAPGPARIGEHRRSRLAGGEIVDLSFPSGFTPRWERMRDEWAALGPNRIARARVYRHDTPRPAIVCVHGYGGGQWFLEERSFVVRWLYQVGLDVAIPVLPFHAQRASRLPRPGERRSEGPAPRFGGLAPSPTWPSPHIGRTNEGFAQAIEDLRTLTAWLRARGAPSVSACGMSLGAATTALLATVEALDFAALMIPVASFAELFWQHGEGRPERAAAEREGITLERMKAALEVTTPIARRPRLSGERVLVLDAQGDRIAPPIHAAWLAEHFGARRRTLPGGHLLLARGEPLKEIVRSLRELDLLRR